MTDLTLLEIQDKMRSKILLETPFAPVELSDEILEASIDKALSSLDSYKPRIVKNMGPLANDDYILIRAYNNELDSTSIVPYIQEIGMDTAMLYIYSAPWTPEKCYSDRLVKSIFGNLVVYNAALMMANVRRSADVSVIPIDLKGDSFYSEFKERLDSLVETLQNTTCNTL